MRRNFSQPSLWGDQLCSLVSGSFGPAQYSMYLTLMIIQPALSALQNWPSGTSLQQYPSAPSRIEALNEVLRRHTHISFNEECASYQVTVRADIVFMDPEDGSASLCALTSVCEPAGPIWKKKWWLKKSNIFWLTLECSPRGRQLCYKPFQVRGRRTTLMKKEKGHIMIVPYYIMLVPWPTSHHLVVVVGPQVGLLAV